MNRPTPATSSSVPYVFLVVLAMVSLLTVTFILYEQSRVTSLLDEDARELPCVDAGTWQNVIASSWRRRFRPEDAVMAGVGIGAVESGTLRLTILRYLGILCLGSVIVSTESLISQRYRGFIEAPKIW